MHTQTLDEILSLPTVSSGEVVITKKYGLLDDPVEIQKQRDAGPKPNQLWLARNINDDNDDIDDMMYVMVTNVLSGIDGFNDGELVQVIPMENDERLQTNESLVIHRGSPIEMDMVTWPSLEATIPVSILRKPLRFFPDDIAAMITGSDDPDGDGVARGHDPSEPWSDAFNRLDGIIRKLLEWHFMCLPSADK